MDDRQTIYSSNDVSTLLNVKDSTLRKYCLMLERAGYKIDKGKQGTRAFYNQDVIVLQKVIDIKKQPDMTLEQACKGVVAWVNAGNMTDDDTSDTTVITRDSSYNNAYEELIRQFKKTQDFNQVLIERMDQQQKQIDFLMKDHHEKHDKVIAAIKEIPQQQVKAVIKETQLQQQETATTSENAKEEPKKKKKFWFF